MHIIQLQRSMKKTGLILLLMASLAARAQQQYLTEQNIRYYPDSAVKADNYIASQCLLDLYYPANTAHFATIVWFHGGGLTGGDKEIPAQLMKQGYAVIGVQYRLSPKAKAPAYIEDAAAAIAWVFKHISKYGGDDKLIFISGHSAGAYLGMMVTLDKRYLDKYHIDADSIAAVISLSAQAITHYTIRQERGIKDTQPVIDAYAPLYHVRAGAPPILLITGDAEKELLGRYEENAYLLRMLKLAGHNRSRLYQLQGFDHGGMAAPAFPLLLKEMASVIAGKK